MRSRLFFYLAALMLAGCLDSGSGGGSNNRDGPITDDSTETPVEEIDGDDSDHLDDQITLPGDSYIPETPVQERESDGSTTSGDAFTARRFIIQGDSDAATYVTAGLKAVPDDNNSNIDTVDDLALPAVQLVTIPIREESERFKPAGVLFRRDEQFRFASASTTDSPRQVTSESSVASTCIAAFSYGTSTTAQTAVAFNRSRDAESDDCRSQFKAGLQWYQLKLGDDAETPAGAFNADHIPAVPLNAANGNPPEWLVLDRSGDTPQLAVVSSDDLSTATPVNGSSELAGSFDEVHRLAQLSAGSLLLAYGMPASDGAAASYRLAHYDRNANSVNDLVAGEALNRALGALPSPSWITTDDGKAYVGIGNALLEADSETYTLLDRVSGAGRPFFVMSSDTHVLWGSLSRTDDSERRQVRLVRHGHPGGAALVVAPYLETRARGTANGWFYFTAALDALDNGRLATSFAIGLNPDLSSNNGFILENAQWIGQSIDNETDRPAQELATAEVTDMFYRSGSDDKLQEVKALENPSAPLQVTDDVVELPSVTLGRLPESFSAVFMGEGFGPQRLLTAVSVASSEDVGGESDLEPGEFSVTRRVYHLDPRTPDSLREVSENDGSLVRALPLF